jgi:hypothetical protein
VALYALDDNVKLIGYGTEPNGTVESRVGRDIRIPRFSLLLMCRSFAHAGSPGVSAGPQTRVHIALKHGADVHGRVALAKGAADPRTHVFLAT